MKAFFFTASLTVLIVGMAGAQVDPWENGLGTPDGLPPAFEDVCDMTVGAAHGLCVAFCEAMDCESPDPQASEQACTKVGNRYVQITGELPPCLSSCPCWDASDLDSVTAANQHPFASCVAAPGGAVIQNDGSTPGVEGGFATLDFGAGPQCLTRDQLFGLSITPEEASTCTAQIEARCEEIGTPVSGGGGGGGGEPPA